MLSHESIGKYASVQFLNIDKGRIWSFARFPINFVLKYVSYNTQNTQRGVLNYAAFLHCPEISSLIVPNVFPKTLLSTILSCVHPPVIKNMFPPLNFSPYVFWIFLNFISYNKMSVIFIYASRVNLSSLLLKCLLIFLSFVLT